MKTASIGIFDSGFGGLTVMNAITALLPNENIIYFADTINLPYGSKSSEELFKCSLKSIEFLASQGIKLLVIACHSSCVTSFSLLQNHFSFPIVSISNAGIKELTSQKKTNNLAILGTEATINSQVYQQAIHAKFSKCKVLAVACPLFVPLIEMGYINKPLITQPTVQKSLHPLKDSEDSIDAVLLACTHYPLLKKPIQLELGLKTVLIDPSKSCAREVKQSLIHNNLCNDSLSTTQHQFYVSKDPEKFQTIGKLFFSSPIEPICCAKSTFFSQI